MSDALLHGGELARAIERYGGNRPEWLDLSTGINPRPWPVPMLSEEIWQRLPEAAQHCDLEDAAGQFYRVNGNQTVVAIPGTQALIELLPTMLPGKSAAILRTQTGVYGEHGHCLEKRGWQVRTCADMHEAEGANLVVLVHPNNPDGYLWDREAVRGLAGRLEKRGGHVIVDEAFCDTVPEESFVNDAPANMIILKSFGKFFGLAGLRLGFAIAAPEIAEKIRSRLGPWAVSGPAIEIGKKALADRAWPERTRSWLEEQSSALVEALESCGFRRAGRHSLFVLGEREDACAGAERLARRHILVRHFPDRPTLLRFGLPGDNAKLMRLAEALAG